MKSALIVVSLASLAIQAASAADDVGKSGKQLYEQYCASCHGASGRGDGPVAKALTIETPDLTRLAQRRGAFFDRDLVERVIDGRHVIGAHGSRTMPVWGEDLSLSQLGNPDAERGTRLVIVRLADYVWQLQRVDSDAASRDTPTK
jgi:mono/diheme cytochrome c family protein